MWSMHFLPHKTFGKSTFCTIYIFFPKQPVDARLGTCYQLFSTGIMWNHGIKVNCITGACLHERRTVWTQVAWDVFVLLMFNWKQNWGRKLLPAAAAVSPLPHMLCVHRWSSAYSTLAVTSGYCYLVMSSKHSGHSPLASIRTAYFLFFKP